jgi:hypothetical protein
MPPAQGCTCLDEGLQEDTWAAAAAAAAATAAAAAAGAACRGLGGGGRIRAPGLLPPPHNLHNTIRASHPQPPAPAAERHRALESSERGLEERVRARACRIVDARIKENTASRLDHSSAFFAATLDPNRLRHVRPAPSDGAGACRSSPPADGRTTCRGDRCNVRGGWLFVRVFVLVSAAGCAAADDCRRGPPCMPFPRRDDDVNVAAAELAEKCVGGPAAGANGRR